MNYVTEMERIETETKVKGEKNNMAANVETMFSVREKPWHTFSNDRVTAKINLFKVDKETGKAVPQGDATLKGAVYGLYAREDIVHPDGATGTIYKAGEQIASLTTDDKGQASVNGLYLGKYYIKEITPPTGYLADTEEHDLTCSYEGDMTAEVKRECTSSEQVIKQP